MEECRYSSTFDTVSFGNLPTGKQTIVARLQGNDAFGFKQEFTARQNIFVMPRIESRQLRRACNGRSYRLVGIVGNVEQHTGQMG